MFDRLATFLTLLVKHFFWYCQISTTRSIQQGVCTCALAIPSLFHSVGPQCFFGRGQTVKHLLLSKSKMFDQQCLIVWPGPLSHRSFANKLGNCFNVSIKTKMFSSFKGCVLRNTEWVYGLVIFTGHDTKLMMNSGTFLLSLFLLQIIVCS